MKITDLYRREGYPIVITVLALVSFTASCAVLLVPEWFDQLCLQTNADHMWQYMTGVLIHHIHPWWVMWIHLGMNFMSLIPLGIIVEKVLGSRMTLYIILTEWFVTAVVFQLVSSKIPTTACGISTIEYALAIVGFYCIYVTLRTGNTNTRFYKQPLLYYFLFELLGMLGMLNPAKGIVPWSLHISGVIVGFLFLLILRKRIKCAVNRSN